MCGIAGILNFDPEKGVDPHLVERMNARITHRGPNDCGYYFKGQIGLGHRRLSIIDLKAGNQPMISDNRSAVLVFNGEIYNYRELREDLTKRGVVFRTNSDTEVLLNLIETENPAWGERVNGMYAFAYWDERAKTLVLARDRLGIKPLYYVILADSVLFASEVKVLLAHPEVPRVVNLAKLAEQLMFWSLGGDETLFKGISQVPSGHMLIFSPGNKEPQVVSIWDEGRGTAVEDFVDADMSIPDQLQSLLYSSVQYRLISEVPLGTFNSGGVDSSLITAMVRSVHGGELHTFSVGFEEASYDERKHAKKVAKLLGTTHHTLVINEREYTAGLESAIWCLEEPLTHPHTVQLIELSRFAKKYVTVVLTGEGADELFGGYPRYKLPLLMQGCRPFYMPDAMVSVLCRLKARKLIKIFEALEMNRDKELALIHNARPIPLSDYRRLALQNCRFTERLKTLRQGSQRFHSFLSRLLYLDQRTYLSALLKRLDKTSMSAGVEARVPFLDYRIIEWSYLIPDRDKIRGLTNKFVVKQVANSWLPTDIVNRKKVGFGVPVAEWLRNPKGLGGYLDILRENRSLDRSFADRKTVNMMITDHMSGRQDHSQILWGMLNLELWQRMFIDQGAITQ
jgi:asparagine synthase (glutamine-hydrolysing)